MTYETRFKPGDEVFYVDIDARAPVGPAQITELSIYANTDGRDAIVSYRFGIGSRREGEVFSTHDEALKKSRDPEWILSKIRA